jgi:hypothetical protein
MNSVCEETTLSVGRREFPSEMLTLKQRIQGQPDSVRAELEPLIDDVLEHAMFRDRVMMIARDALERLRLDVATLKFDLDATRRERSSV